MGGPARAQEWKDGEEDILKVIEPIAILTKEILHSSRFYLNLLLRYAEKNLGIHFVDRNPQFGNSRCLFVVRTDGGWIDFSYQKCLQAYV